MSRLKFLARRPSSAAASWPTSESSSGLRGFTLVEMLLAMAITLVMMGAVVTLFANVSNSVRNRRATIEMSSQLRHVRNMLQQDLAGATCPGLTWQRPESNHGYIEIIEGPYRDGYASALMDGDPGTGELDRTTSLIPSSNLPLAPGEVTDGAGLGDYDDVLMLTVRNEHEPFVGRAPRVEGEFPHWPFDTIESPLAEVVWFAVENPAVSEDPENFFGEPGMRTIFRRALLIAPWVNPYLPLADPVTGLFQAPGGPFKAEPGLVRILPASVGRDNVAVALAALVAFQDRYDLSVRLEFDPRMGNSGRYKILANTLGDLTKRENRYGHHFLRPDANPPRREYPFAALSAGSGYSGSAPVSFAMDPEFGAPNQAASASANVVNGSVPSYAVTAPGNGYLVRPFALVNASSATIATARAMLNDDGQVVRVVQGLVPLWGTRRGEDVMLSDALAFDLRVYDPGAPLYGHIATETVLNPNDAGWAAVTNTGSQFSFVGQGAYVNLGYGSVNYALLPPPSSPWPTAPWYFAPRALSDVYLSARPLNTELSSQLAPGYAVYDTWSFHYENNGLNEDQFRLDGSSWVAVDFEVDEGTNGLDSLGHYSDNLNPQMRLGVDDVGERETAPPYDKPLRGIQVLIRLYERDSRQIRQVRVNQHFMPE